MRYAVVIGVILLVTAAVYAAGEIDYLNVTSSSINPKYTITAEDPLAATVTLERVSEILPEASRLNITVWAVNPSITLNIDGNETFVNKNSIEISLPSEGVKKIVIDVSGKAPYVEKLTAFKVFDVKTYVKFTGTEGEYQDEISISLDVTKPKIEEALDAINRANGLSDEAEALIENLKSEGIGAADLEAQLADAKAILRHAETAHEGGRISEAKENADLAINAFNRVISDAGGLEAARESKSNVKKYGAAALAVVVIALLILFLQKRREELG